tara:strand:- start:67 stop:318 length:252 start_codon:yes stop_codon:yes gene_type:complete
MTTYAAIKYAIPGTAITGVLKTASNLNDVAAKDTSRDNLGVEIGVDVQGFFSASAGTNANGARTVSTSSPSGGSDGDVWYKYS